MSILGINIFRQGVFLANALLLSLPCSLPITHAQQVVLRDLSIVEASVIRFDVDGVSLDNNQHLGWQEIHKADVRSNQRQAFETLKIEIGIPVLRIHQRIANRDFENLAEIGKQLLDRCGQDPSNTARLAAAAWCRGEIANGNRERACVALLRMLQIEGELKSSEVAFWDIKEVIRIDSNSEIENRLLPAWFDSVAATKAWQQLKSLEPTPTAKTSTQVIYLASLAISAGDWPNVKILLDDQAIQNSRWLKILQAQQMIAKSDFEPVIQSLPDDFERIDSPQTCMTLYYRGIAGLKLTDETRQRAALLELLQIPASASESYPEIAAASIYQAMQTETIREKPASSISLKQELLQSYSRTYFGRNIQTLEQANLK